MKKKNYTLEELNEMMEKNSGSLYLSGTGITSLPDNLAVNEIIELTKGQYGGDAFRQFFEEE